MKTSFENFKISDVEQWAPLFESSLLRILLIVLMAWVLLRISHRLINQFRIYMALNADGAEEVKRTDTLARVSKYATSVSIFLISAMLVLSEVGISIAPILGAAGVVGVAVGFGAQSLIKDLFTGFFLLLENQVRQGDIIEVATKSGEVEEITLRYIRLRDYEGNVHFIPNGLVTVVTNKTREFAFALIEVDIPYDVEINKAIEIMHMVSHDLRNDSTFGPKILEDIEIAGVEKISNGAVMLKARIKVKPIEQWDTRREYLKRLKTALYEHGIDMPVPHSAVYNIKKIETIQPRKGPHIPKED